MKDMGGSFLIESPVDKKRFRLRNMSNLIPITSNNDNNTIAQAS